MNLDNLLTRNHLFGPRPEPSESERILPLSEGVIVADHAFAIQTANAAAADLLGWDDPSELVRDLAGDSLQIFDPTRGREIQVALVMRGRWAGTAFLERRDGTLFEAYLTACSLHASSGLPSGVVITIRQPMVVPSAADAPAEGESFGVDGLPGSFSLFYQPEIDLEDGSVRCCEALLRWWHPGLGIVSPGLALANPRWAQRLARLEAWSVFAACRQVSTWEEQGRPVQVALNVSENQLKDAELLGRVHQALALTGIHPEHLGVELPLSALVSQPDRSRQVAIDLVNLGVTVIVDGVTAGTPRGLFAGVPATVLKIQPDLGPSDRRPGGVGALPPAVAMARSIGAHSVAMAVETAQDLRTVRDQGFDRAFGHVFSPALAPAALAPMLGRRDVEFGQRAG